MTTVNVVKDQNEIKEITVSDHTGYADYGKDVVCAGISTLTFSVINKLKDNSEFEYNVNEETTTVTLKAKGNNCEVQNYLNYLVDSLKMMDANYPGNLEIKE